MDIRELDPGEWADFFEAFSRHYRGRRVTLECPERGGLEGPTCVIARHVPLIGITAEPRAGDVRSIGVIVGNSIDDHLLHVIHAPRRVRVAQVSNGQDEVLTIESFTDPTVRVDFGLTEADNPVLATSTGQMRPDPALSPRR